MSEMKVLYRVVDRLESCGVDEFEMSLGTRTVVVMLQYPVKRCTNRGVWIDEFGKERFVLNDARKRYAYPTEEQAVASFLARKKRQRALLTLQLQSVDIAIERANSKAITRCFAT